MKEKKDRVDDALQATKAAIEEGIVPGGGAALLYAREGIENQDEIGPQIVYQACGKPFEQILINAGYDQVKAKMLAMNFVTSETNWEGYNLKTEEITNMKEAGIIDPAKVTRAALENAASVAGTILLTECTVVDKPQENNNQVDPMSMMGGMM